MRKADYNILASVIREERAQARVVLANPDRSLPDDTTYARATLTTSRDIAQRFASLASVDRVAFLKACGIEP